MISNDLEALVLLIQLNAPPMNTLGFKTVNYLVKYLFKYCIFDFIFRIKFCQLSLVIIEYAAVVLNGFVGAKKMHPIFFAALPGGIEPQTKKY